MRDVECDPRANARRRLGHKEPLIFLKLHLVKAEELTKNGFLKLVKLNESSFDLTPLDVKSCLTTKRPSRLPEAGS